MIKSLKLGCVRGCKFSVLCRRDRGKPGKFFIVVTLILCIFLIVILFFLMSLRLRATFYE